MAKGLNTPFPTPTALYSASMSAKYSISGYDAPPPLSGPAPCIPYGKQIETFQHTTLPSSTVNVRNLCSFVVDFTPSVHTRPLQSPKLNEVTSGNLYISSLCRPWQCWRQAWATLPKPAFCFPR